MHSTSSCWTDATRREPPAPLDFFAMADFMKILQQAQQMQGRLQEIQDQLQQQTVTGSAGGGMVTVEADGKGQVRRVKLDPSVVSATDVEMLEDLIQVAVAEAQKKAAALAQEEMGKLTGGIPLPFKLPF
jgi:hypothetical protein